MIAIQKSRHSLSTQEIGLPSNHLPLWHHNWVPQFNGTKQDQQKWVVSCSCQPPRVWWVAMDDSKSAKGRDLNLPLSWTCSQLSHLSPSLSLWTSGGAFWYCFPSFSTAWPRWSIPIGPKVKWLDVHLQPLNLHRASTHQRQLHRVGTSMCLTAFSEAAL